MKEPAPTLVKLVLRPAPGFSGEPILRLRHLLKRMLRDFGWKCTHAEGIDAAAEPAPEAPAAPERS